ncbi:MAG: hypothetical protein DMF72_20685 [Acidobacteria bacterium]|nr:MAG: hypothetical protein DMF72_20685 [Acidobacteriota bacterium]
MRKHSGRTAYYISENLVITEPPDLFGAPEPEQPPTVAPFKFGWMFDRAPGLAPAPRQEMIDKLVKLGKAMNDAPPGGDTTIPSGYTYLGQFIAHEISFDKTVSLDDEELSPESYRSPSLDLDSLYGIDPQQGESRMLYDDKNPARLKVGQTFAVPRANFEFEQDLPRNENTGTALIGDERNDENLPVAQTTVAFVKFHNKIVETLANKGCAQDQLFNCARVQVIKHFHCLIINDFLPRVLHEDVLNSVRANGPSIFRVSNAADSYMPLEFSAAAFRLGHSMVRDKYEWNHYHSHDIIGASEPVSELFSQTNFSGSIGKNGEPPRLTSDWIIDWRRFFDFTGFPKYDPPLTRNVASKIDTTLGFNLSRIPGFPPQSLTGDRRLLTSRNLLRGFAVGLLSGEEIAGRIGEPELTADELGPGAAFEGHTPLWYYILKEAETREQGKRLGKVGSRIVAETLVGLINASPFSLLKDPAWQPITGRVDPATNKPIFEMVDLLDFADVVDPVGAHLKELYG